jgi:hypothetical protein
MARNAYTLADYRRDIRAPYAWPGGYPRYFITGDGCALSYAAARANRRNIIEAFADGDARGCWAIAGCDINWEDEALTCEHSGQVIQSAYGEGD